MKTKVLWSLRTKSLSLILLVLASSPVCRMYGCLSMRFLMVVPLWSHVIVINSLIKQSFENATYSVETGCLLLKCQHAGTIRHFVDQSQKTQMSTRSQWLLLPHRVCVDKIHEHVNSKGSKPDDLFIYK